MGSACAASRPRRASGLRDPGVATGLAYTAVGGDVLFIEATAYPGRGRLTITGQLGEVMQESAQAALSVRSHADALGAAAGWFAEHDVHIHVPAGAVLKDGPSAGVTMATAIASLVRDELQDDDFVGMTGEITLTGQVLPDRRRPREGPRGAAGQARRVILPLENEPDLGDRLRGAGKLEFVLVDHVEDVDHAFRKRRGSRAAARTAPAGCRFATVTLFARIAVGQDPEDDNEKERTGRMGQDKRQALRHRRHDAALCRPCAAMTATCTTT